jgi:phage FluMu protein Com
MLYEIRCPNCNKFICEGFGEIRRECERCKKHVHALTSQTFGVVYFDGTLPPKELHFKIDGKTVGRMVNVGENKA